MPYIWTSPEIFLEHKGVTIYNVYNGDLLVNPKRTHYFGFSAECNDEGHDSFDVTELPTWNATKDIRAAIIKAIDLGILTENGLMESTEENLESAAPDDRPCSIHQTESLEEDTPWICEECSERFQAR